ncbi:serine threonine protein kinase : Serine/threonine protein kinase OS=Pleurocapsa sp. PCC 7327 GN=Ple7327_4456 PE=4 SV=1 [Gemmata massiliana]|uniref:Serine threonine protein kinase: Serine/threonine protein kinase n=1 Tax=Gemmata massiliana TaxID=1210884 RepID=A0A6P2D864_9BACT|nr:hypothetical protein [Gemmata massiliana]VTR96324.1 serine threonine protein kinase : Serine/threonine protein kinase OS=Pleurocapsa sp. PCC 7327 GN=Ple7327_4456 PE=4 SV=1 [Gemmata massiliana]
MKVNCPCCSAQVPAANFNLETGWAKCEGCQELFALAQVVPGFVAPGSQAGRPVPRPFNARELVERAKDELLIHVPAEGMRAATCGLLGFATVWLAFITFWTAGALGIFGPDEPDAANWVFASFSIPFWLIGFGMLVGVVWKARGTKSVRIDRDGMRTHLRCLAWARSRYVPIDRVQHARKYEPQVKSDGPPPNGAEIVYWAGSFVLPADSEEEAWWLIAEINDFVKATGTA